MSCFQTMSLQCDASISNLCRHFRHMFRAMGAPPKNLTDTEGRSKYVASHAGAGITQVKPWACGQGRMRQQPPSVHVICRRLISRRIPGAVPRLLTPKSASLSARAGVASAQHGLAALRLQISRIFPFRSCLSADIAPTLALRAEAADQWSPSAFGTQWFHPVENPQRPFPCANF